MADETLFADGYDDAVIGYIERVGKPVMVVYATDIIIDILINRDGMTEEEAVEFFETNIKGSWVGEGTPGFLNECTIEELKELIS